MQMIRNGMGFITLSVVLMFCKPKDQKKERDVHVYMEYTISGEEESEVVTGLLQFRRGKNGPNIKLEDPAQVQLDGEVLQPDSVGRNGAFYEFQKSLDEFAGEHAIVFTDENGTQYKEQFVYSPFTIKEALEENIDREDMVFNLEGVSDGEPIKVVMSDTSFYTAGLNEWDTVRNGQVDIRAKLTEVRNGPVMLQLIRESDKYIKAGTAVVGRISVSYGLKREFELGD